MIVFVVPTLVPLMALVPLVIMLNPAVLPIPVARIELLSVVARAHPMSAPIGWSRPVAFVPPVAPSHRIPIAVQPHVIRPWTSGLNVDYTRLRRRPDSDSKRNLCVRRQRAGQ